MRLIDADALMHKLEPIVEAENQIYRRESWGFAVKCRNEVEEAPTIEPSAQQEIIHCRDCRWRNDQNGSTVWLPCRVIVTPSDFYCGRAERREDG